MLWSGLLHRIRRNTEVECLAHSIPEAISILRHAVAPTARMAPRTSLRVGVYPAQWEEPIAAANELGGRFTEVVFAPLVVLGSWPDSWS